MLTREVIFIQKIFPVEKMPAHLLWLRANQWLTGSHQSDSSKPNPAFPLFDFDEGLLVYSCGQSVSLPRTCPFICRAYLQRVGVHRLIKNSFANPYRPILYSLLPLLKDVPETPLENPRCTTPKGDCTFPMEVAQREGSSRA